MDERLRYACFLAFWQLAEAITRSEIRRGDTDEVSRRLAWHGEKLSLKASGYTETLKVFGKKRNDIVHRGIREVGDEDINLLKLACETALQWLMNQHSSLATQVHLELFYQQRTRDNVQLEALKDCVDYIKRTRKTT